MDERQSFFEDDDDDTLLFEKLQEHVLEKYPNPERIGCIDHSTLKTWVYSPQKAGSFRSKVPPRLEVRRVHAGAGRTS